MEETKLYDVLRILESLLLSASLGKGERAFALQRLGGWCGVGAAPVAEEGDSQQQ